MKKSFEQRIAAMNAMYKLPASDRPVLPANIVDRLIKFKTILLEEVHEIDHPQKDGRGRAPAPKQMDDGHAASVLFADDEIGGACHARRRIDACQHSSDVSVVLPAQHEELQRFRKAPRPSAISETARVS